MHYLLIAAVSMASWFSPAEQASITITFKNIKKAKGQILVALRDTKGEMLDGYIVPVTKTGSITYTIKDVKPGKYTIAAYHDINKDEELNTNFMGIPNEPYGFSNDARGTFGPPSFEDQTFTVGGDVKMSITLK